MGNAKVREVLSRMLPPRKRRKSQMDGDHRQRCVDYYVSTHGAQALAEMLVDLEWSEGHEPATE